MRRKLPEAMGSDRVEEGLGLEHKARGGKREGGEEGG